MQIFFFFKVRSSLFENAEGWEAVGWVAWAGGDDGSELSWWAAFPLPCPHCLPCVRCAFNYASFSALIRDLQTALKISSFRAYFVLVKFLSELKEEDNGIKPYAEEHE